MLLRVSDSVAVKETASILTVLTMLTVLAEV